MKKIDLQRLTKSRDFWLWVLFTTSSFFLVSFLVWLIIVSLNNGTHMSTFAANGTFQLYNPLRRLELGQTIGHDFPFFHGIGIPLLHYPLFLLLGDGVFAVEVAKWFVSPIFFLGGAFLFFLAYFRSLKKTVISVAILTIISLSWVDVVWPGNSLIGLRGLLPVLVAGAYFWQSKRIIRFGNKLRLPLNKVVVILLLGASMLFGTEQGVAAILAYAVVNFIIIFRSQKDQWFKKTLHLAVEGAAILSIAFIAFTIATLGHPIDAIRYALIDIPADQGWYFGSDITGYLTWGDLLPRLFDFSMRYMWLVVIAGGMATYILIKHRERAQTGLAPFIFPVVYGVTAFVITIFGYYSPSTQLVPLERMMSLMLVVALVSYLFGQLSSALTPKSPKLYKTSAYTLIVLLVLMIYITTSAAIAKTVATWQGFDVVAELKLAKMARRSDDYFAASTGWKESIDTLRPYIKEGRTIWSLYTGIYNTTLSNQLNPSSGGEDYIIHALGDERRSRYENEFIETRPDYVITLKPSYFDFEEWLWHSHWKIYKQIVTQYDMVSENASSYLWEIKKSPAPVNDQYEKVSITNNTFILPPNTTNHTIVYSVSMKYEASSRIPLAQKLSRYLVKIDSANKAQNLTVSLPNNKTTWSFPVISPPHEGKIVVRAYVDGIDPLASVIVKEASYNTMNISQNNMKLFENNICFIRSKQTATNSADWTCDNLTYTLKQK